jgi:hypothetical protein
MYVPYFEIVFEDAILYSNCPVLANDFHVFHALSVQAVSQLVLQRDVIQLAITARNKIFLE